MRRHHTWEFRGHSTKLDFGLGVKSCSLTFLPESDAVSKKWGQILKCPILEKLDSARRQQAELLGEEWG